MSRTREITDSQPMLKPGEGAAKNLEGYCGFWVALVALLLCFGPSLYRLVLFSADWNSELYSYILLIPFVSLFLAWRNLQSRPERSLPARGMAAAVIMAGLVLLCAYWLADGSGVKLMIDDRLAFTVGSFLLFFFGICCFFIGRQTLRRFAFPLGMLVFIVPFPVGLMKMVETFLQYGSALVAEALFSISGTTFSRERLLFHLPGISFQVAPECSGIHSSLVLLITSLVAGYFFLRTPARRTVLVLAVIPLALLRNGFRIFTIGQLCIHVGPEMIDSQFHHHWAGSLFFVLSLVPLLYMLYFFQTAERVEQGEHCR